MKKQLFTSLLLTLFIGLGIQSFAQNNVAIKDSHSIMSSEKSIVWESKMIDLGNIQKDVATDATFEFTNHTDNPVVIAKVKSSCGCTVTNYERKAILPGEKGTITATYNAKKSGIFRKNISVLLSDDSKHMISIKGHVLTDNVVVAR